MGNLGPYQDITTAAKQAGGVENLIKKIEEAAVKKASLQILGKGAAIGVVGTLVVSGVAVTVRRSLDAKRDREVLANEAKERLKTVVEEAMKSDGTNPENGGGENDSDRF
ncbi:hypothetical protein O3S80_06630 [Streptomyces sp. Lzd4kr]|nr:hypothetical protein [Streptomyces sp. Lzd4kr]